MRISRSKIEHSNSTLSAGHLGRSRLAAKLAGPVRNCCGYPSLGEEISSSWGFYPTASAAADSIKQKFTAKERDSESGLDYFLARYYSGAQGRFTSVDPENESALSDTKDPQNWNAYTYGRNNPLLYEDPDGRNHIVCDKDGKNCVDMSDDQYDKYRKDNADVKSTPSGDLYVQNDDGSRTNVGHQSYYNEKTWTMFNDIGNMSAPGAKLAGNYMFGMMSFILPETLFGSLAPATGASVKFVEEAAANTPSAGQIAQVQRQLAQFGEKSLLKSLAKFERRLAEHLAKMEEYSQAGGHTSSVQREVQNFRQMIRAIKDTLRK